MIAVTAALRTSKCSKFTRPTALAASGPSAAPRRSGTRLQFGDSYCISAMEIQ